MMKRVYSINSAAEILRLDKTTVGNLRGILCTKGLLKKGESLNDFHIELLETAKKCRPYSTVRWADAIDEAMQINDKPSESSVAVHPFANILAHDGSIDDLAAEVLSQFGDDYADALSASVAVSDFFKKAELNDLVNFWNAMTDVVFRAAAFDIAHTQGRIQP